MNRYWIGIFLLIFVVPPAQGQKSEGGVPLSTNALIGLKSSSGIPEMHLDALNVEKLISEKDSTKLYPTYGIVKDTIIDIKKAGVANAVSGGGKIWRIRISNATAKSLQLYFSKYKVPSGAKLFIYNDDLSAIAGAFTKENMQQDESFTIADFRGNHVIIEYYEPSYAEYEGSVILGAIGQAYVDIFDLQSSDDFVNINCPIGKDAQLAKHAVCMITFISGSSQGFCSGALINNANQDGKPYFLTAHHCLSSSTEAATLVAYFNYEVAGCDGEMLTSSTLSGSTLLSTGAPSDYTLLLLNSKPGSDYQPYYAGWDITGEESDTVTGIHVPYLQTKKISIDYDSIYTYPYTIEWEEGSDSPANTHWVLYYDVGTTSSGSSGSPLFNNKNQIIGQLHGGGDDVDLYGKLSYSYTHKPTAYPLIKTYLDPNSTNIKKLDGYIPGGNVPDAFFSTEYEQVCYNTPIEFTDYSVFGPFDRLWSINPLNFTFSGGTTETSQNPVIQFTKDTTYTVELKLSVGGVVKSTESLKIKAGKSLDVSVYQKNQEDICDCDFDTLQLSGSGAESYQWQVMPDDEDKILLTGEHNNTATVKRIPTYSADSTYTLNVRVIGTQSTCSDTVFYATNIVKPSNDNVAHAIEIGYGRSDVYSNVCATEEDGEPVPPSTSCTSQNAWCDCIMEESNQNDIVDNSVWFKFIPVKTGNISISSAGFDNQIALYEAETYNDLLTNNYTLLGANDDRSDVDYRPLIKSEAVTAGKTYWIQVDGSACGAEEEFYIIVNDLSATSTNETIIGSFVVYPQPAGDQLNIRIEENSGSEASLSIYTLSGSCLYNIKILLDGSTITLDSSKWEPGVYIMMMRTANTNYVSKIIKE
jgi:V8-like Glu-specific endopeptidase